MAVTGPTSLTEIERAILEHCRRPGGASLSSLKRFGRTAKHEAAKRLADRGLLERPRHGLWRTTAEGVRLLETSATSDSDPDPITVMWPTLATLPAEALKAHFRLHALAVFARTRGIVTSHLPFFPVFAPTLKGKTMYGTIVCHAHGVPPAVGLINVLAEAGKSVGVRRSGTGRISTKRKAMSGPVIVFDEAHKATPEVWRSIRPYLAGEREIASEEGVLDIPATTILLSNPRTPPDAGLERRTGLDETLLRRSIPFDMEFVPIPASWRIDGPKVLEAAARASPIRFPEPVSPVHVVREDVARALDRIVRSEFARWVDVELVFGLCVAAASLGIPDPVLYVLTNWAIVTHTVNWVKDGWRDLLGGTAGDEPEPPKGGTGFEPSDLGGQVIAMAGDEAVLTYEANAAAFERLCDALGMPPDRVLDRLRRVVAREETGLTDAVLDEILRSWERTGRNPQKTVEEIGDLLDTYDTLADADDKVFREFRATQERYDALGKAADARGGFDVIERADRVLPMVGRLGVTMEVVEQFLGAFLEGAKARGWEPKKAGGEAFEAVCRHADAFQAEGEHVRRVDALKPEIAALEGRVRDLGTRSLELVAEAMAAEARHRDAEADRARFRAEVEKAAATLAATEAAIREAQGTAATVQEAVAAAAAREAAAAEVLARCEAREHALAEREAAVALQEEDADAGRAALHVLDGVYRPYGPPAGRAFRRLAGWADRGAAPVAMQGILEPSRFRNGVLRLARPFLEKDYVTRREHEWEVRGLEAKIADKDAALATLGFKPANPRKPRPDPSDTGGAGGG